MSFKINIEPEAFEDIQMAMIWYEKQQEGLGERFYNEVDNAFDSLRINPFLQVRYGNTRCLPLKKFPYMIHFYT